MVVAYVSLVTIALEQSLGRPVILAVLGGVRQGGYVEICRLLRSVFHPEAPFGEQQPPNRFDDVKAHLDGGLEKSGKHRILPSRLEMMLQMVASLEVRAMATDDLAATLSFGAGDTLFAWALVEQVSLVRRYGYDAIYVMAFRR